VLASQPPNVHVQRFVPQEDLLPHCAAVVSHAGSGTFLGAAAHGLPQVCVPQGADQFLNAEACARAGAGLSIDDPEPASVRDALHRVLRQPAFATSARVIQAELAAMPTAVEIAAPTR
jgi:UDP:flavonoid glycosyltransferase YjiC (YdhE family)